MNIWRHVGFWYYMGRKYGGSRWMGVRNARAGLAHYVRSRGRWPKRWDA